MVSNNYAAAGSRHLSTLQTSEKGWLPARPLLGGGVGKAVNQLAAALRQQRAFISVALRDPIGSRKQLFKARRTILPARPEFTLPTDNPEIALKAAARRQARLMLWLTPMRLSSPHTPDERGLSVEREVDLGQTWARCIEPLRHSADRLKVWRYECGSLRFRIND